MFVQDVMMSGTGRRTVELKALSHAATDLGVALHSVEVTVDGEPVVSAGLPSLGVGAPPPIL
jgi:hypothetical protein